MTTNKSVSLLFLPAMPPQQATGIFFSSRDVWAEVKVRHLFSLVPLQWRTFYRTYLIGTFCTKIFFLFGGVTKKKLQKILLPPFRLVFRHCSLSTYLSWYQYSFFAGPKFEFGNNIIPAGYLRVSKNDPFLATEWSALFVGSGTKIKKQYYHGTWGRGSQRYPMLGRQ